MNSGTQPQTLQSVMFKNKDGHSFENTEAGEESSGRETVVGHPLI